MPAICDVLLGVMLYQSRLVPRRLSMIGIIGGPVLVVGYLAVMSDTIGQHSGGTALFALPVIVFEFGVGIWLIVKGFDADAVAELEANSRTTTDNDLVIRLDRLEAAPANGAASSAVAQNGDSR